MATSSGTTHSPERQTVVLDVTGMLRASQQHSVEKVLAGRPGVDEVEANAVAQTATVTYDPAVT